MKKIEGMRVTDIVRGNDMGKVMEINIAVSTVSQRMFNGAPWQSNLKPLWTVYQALTGR